MSIKKAVIVAAGLSSRLYPLTLTQPKGLLPIAGTTLLARSITLLRQQGISQIAIVTGYKQDLIKAALGDQITYLPNPFFSHCNNMGSLWVARDFVGSDSFIYLHGDIIYDSVILEETLAHFDTGQDDLVLTTDFGPTDAEAMKVKTKGHFLIESSKEVAHADGEWIGIACCRDPVRLFSVIETTLSNDSLMYYDTDAFTKLAAYSKIYCISTNGARWVEIDFLKDYERAQQLFGH